jgi:hypothetical protein
MVSLLLPSLRLTKAKARDAACVNNLRQLGIATRVYADDHQERLATAEIPKSRCRASATSWRGTWAEMGGATNTRWAMIFRCPADQKNRFAPEGSSYEWKTDLNGRRMDEIRTDSAFLLLKPGDPSGGITNFFMTYPPSATPLLLDYDEFHPRPPQPGKNVVF